MKRTKNTKFINIKFKELNNKENQVCDILYKYRNFVLGTPKIINKKIIIDFRNLPDSDWEPPINNNNKFSIS
ncbi:MAG: hypothetical protein H8E98_01225 [Bacteroidetes bacterium]|nr:hypothetical protein [Bacteroidota bacterium]